MQQPMSHEERLGLARALADRALAAYGEKVKAVGAYGSLARGTDAPYSDIELFVVLRTEGEEFTYEWVAGPWKAEVDFYSEEVLLSKARTVDGRWPLTHGSFFRVLPLHDPEGFFERLRAAAASPTDADFRRAICETLYGEVYEFAGKWRNARASGHTAYLATLAVETAQYGAYLIGLHNRQTYSTAARVLEEALVLPDRPDGFDALARLVMSGDLREPLEALETFWAGVQAWAAAHGYPIVSEHRIPF